MPDEDNPAPLDQEVLVSRLAREIARDLVPVEQICERYKLSDDNYQRILRHPLFARRLQEELDIWNASTPRAITERIGSKAATMIEESLIEVYSLIHDKSIPMAPKIEALKWASRMAGIGESATAQAAAGERVRFNIFIGGEKVSFEKDAGNAKAIEGSAVLLDKDPAV